MNKEFIPYEQALSLKELGFDEECLGFYSKDNNLKAVDQHWGMSISGISKSLGYKIDDLTLAPLYQQTFKWFRVVYNLDSFIKKEYKQINQIGYYFGIDKTNCIDFYSPTYKNYEEAELECLKKLIEICKNN
jgi:hypothetical protein